VTGAAKYTADVKLPGMLYAAMVTASVPHARIRNVDVSAAERAPGVKAVHILERLQGVAQSAEDKEKAGRFPLVRFAGQPIAAIAAATQAQAEAAARLVKVDYETLPFVVDADAARKEDAPIVFEGKAEQAGTEGGGGGPKGLSQKGNVRGPAVNGNLGKELETARKKIEEALAASDAVVEGDYRTQVQTHSPLETHGVVADWKPDGLTVYASTQGTISVRDELAAVFELPKSQVRVICEFMGGGFGAKFGAGNYGVLATHLSKKAGVPVRLMYTRKDQHLSVGNRPNSVQRVRIGAKKDGTLTAIHVAGYGTAGVGTGAGFARPAQGLYPCPAILTEESDIFTHAGPAAAFRAPGHPQGVFAFEQAIDELAHKLGIDPLAFRDKIEVDTDRAEAHKVQRQLGAERIGWNKRQAPGSDQGVIKRGLGVAQAIWYRFSNRDSNAEVRITRDGSVELRSAVQDIGTGTRTALAQVVAEELGLKTSDITVRIGDTNFPAGPGSGGSVTLGSMSPPTREAAWQAKKQLLEAVAPGLGAKSADELVMADGRVFLKGDPNKSLTFRAAAGKMQAEELAGRAKRRAEYKTADGKDVKGALAGVQFVQLAVDTGTGNIKVERVVAVHDCGRPVNPMAIQSQVNGGVIQGISYALYEDRLLDPQRGIMVNPNLEQYKIAGSLDTPMVESILIEEYWGRSSTDVAGIGEPVTVPTAAAIGNAFFNATGKRMRELPMTPARVLEVLRSGGSV
jgi:xanthine dehydrogenase YagR molybdenum-binding subunit